MKKIRHGFRALGIIVCLAVWMYSAGSVYRYLQEAEESSAEFEYLENLVENEKALNTEESDGQMANEKNEQGILTEYAALFEQNNDMAGWITIEGTPVNYPVMFTSDQPDFYLKHGFDKEYSAYGVPFVGENCTLSPRSDNLIIYGHHMKNGTMFAALADYENKDFYEKHKVIQFDTLTENGKYEIAAVFKTTVYDTKGFAFYEFVNADKNEKFDEYVRKCKRLSLYETNVIPEYGDDLLTLVTCEYSARNGRMVVVAKKIE